MNTTIRTSERGERWLHNFDKADTATAALLLDGLLLISNDEFQNGVTQTLRSLIESEDRAVALFVAREPEAAEYFDSGDPSRRPSAVGAGAGVGSEGPIAHLIRDLAHQYGAHKVLDHPSIKCMKDTKVRRIILVDDFIGSGQRVRKFIRYLCRNRTIRSWLSYGYIRFTVAVFAATEEGRGNVADNHYVSKIIFNREVEHGRLIWTPSQRENIESLCHRYAERTSRPYWPLGLSSAMTLMIFQHKCPNTCPAIIWAGSNSWEALLEQRPQFSFDEWPQGPSEEHRFSRALESLGQSTLSELQWMKYVAGDARLRFLVLAAIAKRRLRIEVLCAIAEITVETCKKLLRDCRVFGWIGADRRITREGLKELQYARQIKIIDDEIISLTDDIYIPQSFRGVSGSSSAR